MNGEQYDSVLDLQVRMPRIYQVLRHPREDFELAYGSEVDALLEHGLRQGYLVLPLADYREKLQLRNRWMGCCTQERRPYVLIEIGEQWSGQVSYYLGTVPARIPGLSLSFFRHEVGQFLGTLPEQPVAKLPDGQYLEHAAAVGAELGVVAFGPGRHEVIDTVVGYVQETVRGEELRDGA